MDRISRDILAQLSRDSSVTCEQLGDIVGLSPSATHRRVQALEQDGSITGYRAILSQAAQGDPAIMFVSVTLADQRRATMEAFETALARTAYASEAYLITGASDYLIKIAVRSDESYERVHRDILSALPGVQRLVTQTTIRALARAVE